MKHNSGSEYSFLSVNYAEIHNDIKYFLKESDNASDIEISKRFARAAIIFTAFYVESLANLLIDRIRSVFGSLADFETFINKRDHRPKPLRVLFGVYVKIQNKTLSQGTKIVWPLNTAVIKDLFLIRNQVLAHPPARSTIGGTNVIPGKGLTQDGKDLELKRFTHFPNIYTGFTYIHAHEIYTETKKFLEGYGRLIENSPFGNELVGMFK